MSEMAQSGEPGKPQSGFRDKEHPVFGKLFTMFYSSSVFMIASQLNIIIPVSMIYAASKPSLGELTKLTYMKDGKEEKIEVIEVVAQQWMKFGTVGLGLEEYKVTNCHRVGQKDVDTCREVFKESSTHTLCIRARIIYM